MWALPLSPSRKVQFEVFVNTPSTRRVADPRDYFTLYHSFLTKFCTPPRGRGHPTTSPLHPLSLFLTKFFTPPCGLIHRDRPPKSRQTPQNRGF